MNSVVREILQSLERNAWVCWLSLVVALALVALVHTKWAAVRPYSGSFAEPFVSNEIRNQSQIQSQIQSQSVYEVGEIINKYPDISNQTVALDVGAGTGEYMHAFIQNGITNVTGIESSARAKQADPALKIVKGDPATTAAFQPESFTLVTVMNFEVYYVPNPEKLVSNIYTWLKPGGYFVLHLVDPQRFNASTLRSVSDSKVFPNDSVQYMEVFKPDGNGRKKVHIPPPHEFIALATGVGFNMLGQIDLIKAHKEYQYLYLFYKPAN